MYQVKDVINVDVSTIAADVTVEEAIRQLVDKRISGMPVVDHEDHLVGIISERDILQRVVAERRDVAETLVREVMTTEVIYGERDTTIDEARGIMMKCRIRHLPVLDNGRLVGLISIGDLNAHRVNHQELEIHLLNQYIIGQV